MFSKIIKGLLCVFSETTWCVIVCCISGAWASRAISVKVRKTQITLLTYYVMFFPLEGAKIVYHFGTLCFISFVYNAHTMCTLIIYYFVFCFIFVLETFFGVFQVTFFSGPNQPLDFIIFAGWNLFWIACIFVFTFWLIIFDFF